MKTYILEAWDKANRRWEPAGNPTSDSFVRGHRNAVAGRRELIEGWECPASEVRYRAVTRQEAENSVGAPLRACEEIGSYP